MITETLKWRYRLSFYALCSFLALFLPAAVHAGQFSVSPIRMDFGKDVKTGVVTVSAEGADRLNLQMRAFEWTEDAQGKDVYTETQDLIFFPRMMTLSKGEKRIVRAGIEWPPAAKEKAYRLFVEEIPSPQKKPGVNVSITLRFGIPVFVKPLKTALGTEIEKADVSRGSANVTVKNTGNVHLVIDSITFTGKNGAGAEIFSKDLAGWYLLAGASRTYTASIPSGVCGKISKLYIDVTAGRISLKKELAMNGGMCLAKSRDNRHPEKTP